MAYKLDHLHAALAQAPGRQFTAAAYWPRLQPILRDYDITRVGDITGLDRVGLPVVQVSRPTACSNAVTQGKGSSVMVAAVGAVLECVEMAVGEDTSRHSRWPETVSPDQAALWSDLAPPGANWPDPSTRWTWGLNVATGEAGPVPLAVIDTDFSVQSAAAAAPIVRSSIGLGAGATWAEAAWHGLLEAIENDARLRCRAGVAALDLMAIADTATRDWIARLEPLGLRVTARDLTQRQGPICLSVQVIEDPERPSALPLPAEGFAARPTASQALAAALFEALQARLALISGAREDMTHALYAARQPDTLRWLDWQSAAQATAPLLSAQCSAKTVCDLARTLTALGLGPVFAVPLLARADVPLYVMRIVAPRLIADPERLSWADAA